MSLFYGRLICAGFAIVFALIWQPAIADEQKDLIMRITRLLAPDDSRPNQPTLHIKILTPVAKLNQLCPQPDLRLSGRSVRLTGNRSVIAKCDNKQHFIQVNVSATGRYWIVRQTLTPGQLVREQDIQTVTGELDRLPAGLLLDEQQIVGAMPTRLIRPGLPITSNQLRPRWAVEANKEVTIAAPGNGFVIHTKGKVLSNAAENESVKVQTRTGQIILATVIGEGVVSINMMN